MHGQQLCASLCVMPARGNPACRGTFGGRRKAVRDRFALHPPGSAVPGILQARTLEWVNTAQVVDISIAPRQKHMLWFACSWLREG